MKSLLTRRPTLSFFVLTFALAWSYWLVLGFVVKVPTTALILPGAWAPSVVALGLSALSGGRARVKELLERLFRWRVAPVWYGSAILGPSLLAACALGVDTLLSGTLPTLAVFTAKFGLRADQALLFLLLLPVVYLVTVFAGGPVAEELGWRGFAQARLSPRFGTLGAGLVIGVLWALWHLPLFWLSPAATGNLPLPFFMALVPAWSALLGLLFEQARGSVLITILAHAGINFVVGALGLFTLTQNIAPLVLFVLLNWLAVFGAWLYERRRGTRLGVAAKG